MLAPIAVTTHADVPIDGWLVPHLSWKDQGGGESHKFLRPRRKRGTQRRELWVAECAMRKLFPNWLSMTPVADNTGWTIYVEPPVKEA